MTWIIHVRKLCGSTGVCHVNTGLKHVINSSVVLYTVMAPTWPDGVVEAVGDAVAPKGKMERG